MVKIIQVTVDVNGAVALHDLDGIAYGASTWIQRNVQCRMLGYGVLDGPPAPIVEKAPDVLASPAVMIKERSRPIQLMDELL